MKKITTLCLLILVSLVIYTLRAEERKLKVTVNNNEFTATLNNNETVDAFLTLLPIEVNMTEMGGYEKYYNLPQSLPGVSSNVGTTYEGDLMIWSSNCLVLFYVTRSTSYSYIRMGRIDDTIGLQAAVGRGNVQVKFEKIAQSTAVETIETSDSQMYELSTNHNYLEVSGEVEQLSLYTLNGTNVAISSDNSLVTTGIQPGVYLLKIDTREQGTITKKVIKN